MSKPMASTPEQGRGARLSAFWKIVISLLVTAHLIAVFSAPWSVPPTSDVSRGLVEITRPYLSATRLLAYYRYFYPGPGACHFIRYTITMPDGTTQEGRFPDIDKNRPRLFYHRYFMMAEALNRVYPINPSGVDSNNPAALKDLARQREAFETIFQSYAQQLLRENGGKKVKLTLVAHDYPSPAEFYPESYPDRGKPTGNPLPGDPEVIPRPGDEPKRRPSVDPLHDPQHFRIVTEFTAEAKP